MKETRCSFCNTRRLDLADLSDFTDFLCWQVSCSWADMLTDIPLNRITAIIIEAAIAVHRALGPGLLESAYTTCLIFELRRRGLKVEEQRPVPLNYCGVKLDCGYRLDRFAPIHTAQMLTYLRLTGCPVGPLLNFNAPILKEGLKRVLNTRSPVDSGTGQPNTHD